MLNIFTLANGRLFQEEIESLEELEEAAHDGRLERVEGFGPRRAKLIRETLAARLARRPPASTPPPSGSGDPSRRRLPLPAMRDRRRLP